MGRDEFGRMREGERGEGEGDAKRRFEEFRQNQSSKNKNESNKSHSSKHRNRDRDGDRDRYKSDNERQKSSHQHRRTDASRSRERRERQERSRAEYHPRDRYQPEQPPPPPPPMPKFQRGDIVKGTVTRMESYGAFVAISPIDLDPTNLVQNGSQPMQALAHISQIAPDATRINHPSEILALQQQVYAIVLESYQEGNQYNNRTREKISVSIKGVDQLNSLPKDETEWRMPPPRRPEGLDDYGPVGGYDGGMTGAEMMAAYSNANGGGGDARGSGNRGGNSRNKPQNLSQRAKDRMELRMRQTGHQTWRDEYNSNLHGRLWGRSPSVEMKRHVSSSGSGSGSGDDSGSDGDSSSSSSSSEDSRRRRRNKYSKGKGKKRDDDRSKRRRRRSYSSSSSSSTSASPSSSSVIPSGDKKRARKSTDKKVADASNQDRKQIGESSENDHPLITNPPEQEEQIDEEDLREAREFKKAVQRKDIDKDSDSEDDDMGPMPLVNPDSNANASSNQNQKAYGKALLPGEGEALAQYVQQNLRIPRRGEIGYDAEDIDHYEKSGYVMSGSRHARMNAVRIRKENQVYSAEEQRALALITLEEKQQKESALMSDFRTMLQEKQSKMTHAKGKGGDE